MGHRALFPLASHCSLVLKCDSQLMPLSAAITTGSSRSRKSEHASSFRTGRLKVIVRCSEINLSVSKQISLL